VLTVTQAARLEECEGVIERGLQTFVEVGEALMEIRDDKLYLTTHASFDDYCRERWSMRREIADEYVRKAEVAGAFKAIALTPPTIETHYKALAPLRDEPERMGAVWEQAQATAESQERPVTEADIRTARMAVHYSSATDEWATPQDFFDVVNREFSFDLDVCALPGSAKCERFFAPEDDGLAQEWRGTCWMNPPYGDEIVAWVKKAHDAAIDGATVVCLVPARVDTGWWWDYCRYGEIRFLRGRLKFGGSPNSAPFPSALVVFGPDVTPGVVWWER
jgi:phage N-6-adenine-methyltransferase